MGGKGGQEGGDGGQGGGLDISLAPGQPYIFGTITGLDISLQLSSFVLRASFPKPDVVDKGVTAITKAERGAMLELSRLGYQ